MKTKQQLIDQAWAEYEKTRTPAYAEYEKIRDQAYDEYEKKLKEIEENN